MQSVAPSRNQASPSSCDRGTDHFEKSGTLQGQRGDANFSRHAELEGKDQFNTIKRSRSCRGRGGQLGQALLPSQPGRRCSLSRAHSRQFDGFCVVTAWRKTLLDILQVLNIRQDLINAALQRQHPGLLQRGCLLQLRHLVLQLVASGFGFAKIHLELLQAILVHSTRLVCCTGGKQGRGNDSWRLRTRSFWILHLHPAAQPFYRHHLRQLPAQLPAPLPRPQQGPVSIHALQQRRKTYSSDAAALPGRSTSPARPPLPGRPWHGPSELPELSEEGKAAAVRRSLAQTSTGKGGRGRQGLTSCITVASASTSKSFLSNSPSTSLASRCRAATAFSRARTPSAVLLASTFSCVIS